MTIKMDLFELTIGAIVTILTTLTGYAIKKIIDIKTEMVNLKIDMVKIQKKHALDSLNKIGGLFAEIYHDINHIQEGHEMYKELCIENSMRVRREARSVIEIIGDNLVQLITEYTDKSLKFAEFPNDELFETLTNEYDDFRKRLSDERETLIS